MTMTREQKIKELEAIANQELNGVRDWDVDVNENHFYNDGVEDGAVITARDVLAIIKKQEIVIALIKTKIKREEIDGRESCKTIMHIKRIIKDLEENETL